MTVVQRLAVCVAGLLMLAPGLAPALVLGPIEARSALYEPLDARIPIQGARSGDLEGLNVVLGSPAQFELAGVARLQHLGLLEFIVVEEGDGGGYIHVRTEEPIIEPSLTFLVDVDWPRGRTVRGYMLRLTATANRTNPASGSSGAAPEPETGASRTAPASGGTEYGPVRDAETLWSISARLRPDDSVSVQRMMLAIVEANPDAFVIRNVNGLRAGVVLRIPDRDEIGPDDLEAAIAEVRRHQSAWSEHRERRSAAATPSTPTPPSLPRDTEAEPTGRIEVVSSETVAEAAAPEEDAAVEALRKELVLAMEEADAGRRENDELKLRLAETEEHVKELNRLVELKDEEIAALQADLRELSDTTREPPSKPAEGEPQPVSEATEPEATPVPAPVEEEPQPVSEATEAEPTAPPAPAEGEPQPVAEPTEAESIPVPATPEPQQEPAVTAETEPRSLPFGLGALPVNPVFLVGGAGLLLLLLGVLALLRRRRASAGEDDVLELAEEPAADEDNLLLELEAVAADLTDERGDPPDRTSRVGPAAVLAGGTTLESRTRDAAETEPEGLVEERIAELWRDEGDQVPERMVAAGIDPDDDEADISLGIDALTGEDSELDMRDEGMDGDLDIRDLAELAVEGEAAADDTDPDRPTDEAMDRFNRFFRAEEAETIDTSVPEFMPTADSGEPSAYDSEIPDDKRDDMQLAALYDEMPLDAEPRTAETANEGVDRSADPAPERSADLESGAEDGTDEASSTSRALHDEPTDGDDTDAYSLEDIGGDEVQTKIDLAQVYMEMGDMESARGFLEAVLAEGDAQQQDAAREMLEKLA